VPDLSSRGVFLSYRREDAAPYARLLKSELRERFPDTQVFMDLDSIEAGLDFAEVIAEAVDSCAVLVALIGRQWVTLADDEGQRRIDDPDDLVRFEVQTALERGVRVVPVLVDGARPLRQQQLPPELHKLARLNALELSYGRYEYDANQLLDLVQRVLAAASDTGAPYQPSSMADAGALGHATSTESPAVAGSKHRPADAGNDLVTGWQLVDQRERQFYRWPELLEHYDRYHIYRGETPQEGTVFISLGWAVRRGAWGMDRLYIVSFLSQGAPQTPLTEFLAADDYGDTGELIAIIRGSGGGSKMYGPVEDLPPAYAGFRIVTYRDRVQAKGSWNKLAVVAAETDTDTILNHALIQARRRGGL
jgi:TIR domain